jgi:hypothetical protein
VARGGAGHLQGVPRAAETPPPAPAFQRAAENESYIAKVFEQPERERPDGLRYATFKLEDSVSFVHLVSIETGEGRDPLRELPAFKAFLAGVKDRCVEPPAAVTLNEIGSSGFFGE